MPEITRFYGIIIKMFSHNYPHFYALYDEELGIFDINTLEVLEGDLPSRAVDLVKEWAGIHQKELLEMWNTQKIHKLEPLE